MSDLRMTERLGMAIDEIRKLHIELRVLRNCMDVIRTALNEYYRMSERKMESGELDEDEDFAYKAARFAFGHCRANGIDWNRFDNIDKSSKTL